MVLQIIGIILATIGYFTHLFWLFLIGGFICLAMDIFGFLTGKLNPLAPIFLYIVGFVIVGNWTGILAGAVVGNLIDTALVLLGMPFFLFRKEKGEKKLAEKTPKELTKDMDEELSRITDAIKLSKLLPETINIISEYGKVLEDIYGELATEPPEEIEKSGIRMLQPESLLPYSKENIEKAIRMATKVTKTESLKGVLKTALIVLDDFVPDNEVPKNPTENLKKWTEKNKKIS